MESIPEEFVPLKNFFLILLGEAAAKNVFVVILLGILRILPIQYIGNLHLSQTII